MASLANLNFIIPCIFIASSIGFFVYAFRKNDNTTIFNIRRLAIYVISSCLVSFVASTLILMFNESCLEKCESSNRLLTSVEFAGGLAVIMMLLHLVVISVMYVVIVKGSYQCFNEYKNIQTAKEKLEKKKNDFFKKDYRDRNSKSFKLDKAVMEVQILEEEDKYDKIDQNYRKCGADRCEKLALIVSLIMCGILSYPITVTLHGIAYNTYCSKC